MSAEGNTLESFLKTHALSSLLSTLKENEITQLSDLEALENENDVNELIQELGIKSVIQRKKFKRAVLSLIPPSKPEPDTDEHKAPGMNSSNKNKNKNKNKNRIKFKPGINVVPFEKTEYRLPKLKKNQLPSQGGQGFMQSAVTLYTTIKNVVWNKKDDNDSKQNDKIKKRKGVEPERLFATDKHKIILVCGKTGAGKSTLINSMMNYIYGVEYNDKFRLKLIEETKKKGGDADSCTDHISSYKIKKPRGGNIDYDLTIIDTPGFGDSRGVEKDMHILEEFKYIFNKILTNIHGICFVVKSADNRLDASQTYVFNNILNLWAKDVADNIFILMTFADGKRANCIDALNKNDVLKNCHRRLKINNSAFTDDPMDKDFGGLTQFDKLFWDMGMQCFGNFFNSLDEVKPKAIEKSKQVLRKRDKIQTKIYNISKNLDNQLRKQQDIYKEQKFIEKNKADIDAGKEVVQWKNTTENVKKPVSNNLVTTCTVASCQRTCHPGCCVSDKRDCCMMDSTLRCENCGHHADDHTNANYVWEVEYKKIRKSNWDLNPHFKQKYQTATQNQSRSEANLRKLNDDLKFIEKDILNKLSLVHKLRQDLERIALRPHLTTLGDYIDQLIENEENSPQRDQDKINELSKLKEQEDIIMHIETKKPFSEYMQNKR